jgi:tetratricopeptide (TPR) repeat protein
VAISTIAGTPGVGKTALAVHFAHQVADRFPDGQLYVNLRGYDSAEPMDPGSALAGFLHALGVAPASIPAAVHERAALYRSTLAGRRVMVLLDNARSAEQVRDLLPSTPTSLVVVTSRDDLAGLVARDGAHRLILDCLSTADAVGLLGSIVGAPRVAGEPDAAAQLARLCGHLPLALRVVAERAVRRAGSSLAELAGELADEARRLDMLDTPSDPATAVRVVFSWSYQALPSATGRMFRLLGLYEGADFDATAAAVLAGVDGHGSDPDGAGGNEAAAALRTLVNTHLLESPGAGRYRFHDLIRLYAAERAEAQETRRDLDGAVHRLLAWYLRTADAAARVINPHRRHVPLPEHVAGAPARSFDSYDQALGWLETEHVNLVAAVGQAASHGRHDIAWRLPMALWDLFQLGRYWDDWIATYRIALASARHLGDRGAQAGILNRLANAYHAAKRPQEGIDCLRESLEISRETGGRREEASALGNLGNAYHMLGRYEEAIDHFRQALALYRLMGEQYGESSALINLGWALTSVQRFDEAIEHYQHGLAIGRGIGNAYIEGASLSNLAQAHHRLGHLDETIEYGTEALRINEDNGNRLEQAQTLDALGHAYRAQSRPEEARAAWRRAYEIFRELADPRAATVRAGLDSLPAAGQ